MCLNISTPERSLTPDYDSTMSLEASSSRQCTCDHSEAFDDVLKYVGKLRESHSQLEEHFKNLNASYQRDYSLLFEDLKDLQNRRESLEERFIDLTEQYQNDVWNLKKELAATAEKSADRSSDATQDFYEVLEACERRQFKLEQQQQKEEDAGHPETWANTTAQTLVQMHYTENFPLAICSSELQSRLDGGRTSQSIQLHHDWTPAVCHPHE
ncbi:transmembrane and coiled-coil domains protein 1-like isoform X2 [Neolamprologus brichardi]|uniref:transmembrane and coiled-coil domains protein 1-like isoform X2 n=1 Tax=Neolamprologus brichardi TaxID=32507 RepID=UPI0003EC0A12|nr:transmembrane and coiled-coil domains protein 1-like isoform X2 [Neolamprologus brichardi]